MCVCVCVCVCVCARVCVSTLHHHRSLDGLLSTLQVREGTVLLHNLYSKQARRALAPALRRDCVVVTSPLQDKICVSHNCWPSHLPSFNPPHSVHAVVLCSHISLYIHTLYMYACFEARCTCMCVCVCVHVHVQCTCIYIYMYYRCVCVCVCVCVCLPSIITDHWMVCSPLCN